MARRKRIVVANWKMNPQNPGEAKRIFLGIRKAVLSHERVLTVVCPPALFLSQLRKFSTSRTLLLGAQNISTKESGAYTGEISAAMVESLGAEYVIVGHSERRRSGETGHDTSLKIDLALRQNLTPILCVGEEKRDEHGSELAFLASELTESLSGISKKDISKIVIAYEPIWAIGKQAKDAVRPEDLEQTVLYIRKVLSERYGKEEAFALRVIYGGSVEVENAEVLLREGGVDGFLVGHKSLLPEEFGAIVAIADEI